MRMYWELANQLLQIYSNPTANDEYDWRIIGDLSYGFKYMRNYQGLMAQVKDEKEKRMFRDRLKLGLFDIKVKTERNRYDITHKQLFSDLISHSNIDNCIEVWKGYDPYYYSNSNEEYKSLITLMLLMFEQEVNWGDEIFQKFSAFPPSNNSRPRDMLMGFVHMAFVIKDMEKFEYWTGQNKSTPSFGKGGYRNLDSHMKIFFEYYRAVSLEKNPALMDGELKHHFRFYANRTSDNPKLV